MQELNLFIVLDTIRSQGPISKSEISKKHKLSLTTVTSAVNKLMDQGLVTEGGVGKSKGGRKPILIQFSPDSRFLIGVSLCNSRLTIAEMNLNAKIRRKQSFPFETNKGAVLDFILNSLESFLNDCDDLNDCMGISIISQGIVNSVAGIVQYNPKLKFKDVPLKRIIEDRFSIKVWLDNDTNAFILAEKHFSKNQNLENAIYITIGDGVGAGIIVNGMIHRGRQGGAGEFGHTTINQSGLLCDCGNQGCLENYASWPAIYSRILSSIKKGRETMIYSLAGEDINDITPAVFVKALNEGDPLALDLLDVTVTYLSFGIVNFIHLFNPDVIFMGGKIVSGNKFFIDKVKEHINRYALKLLVRDLEIRETSLGEDFEMVGAASVLLQDVFGFSLTDSKAIYT